MAPSGLTLTWVRDRRRRGRAPPLSGSAGTAVLTDPLQVNAALSGPSANSYHSAAFFSYLCSLVSSVCVYFFSQTSVFLILKNLRGKKKC